MTRPVDLPALEWSGPDEDGDLLVTLRGVPNVHVTVHGRTVAEALHCLGDALLLVFEDACPRDEDCSRKQRRWLAGR